MKAYIKNLLREEKIEYSGVLSIRDCNIINQRLFDENCNFAKSVIVFLMPYYYKDCNERNISLYCVPKDYHLFFGTLKEKILKELTGKFPNNRFYMASDHSPIAETSAACKVGLGILGDNHRILNEKYGSFVFIGEIYTDAELEYDLCEIKNCEHCGKCNAACPIDTGECLSSLTQRKGELSAKEIEIIKNSGLAWGCDICQLVCPHNKDIKITPIEFFKKDLLYRLTPNILSEMSKTELKERAFGWRGRKTIERNISLLFDE